MKPEFAPAKWLLTGACIMLIAAMAGGATDASAAAKVTLRVLSYNVNDLPWPLRKKAKKPMKYIGNDLGRRLQEGTAPDIVLLQEAFTDNSKLLVKNANYPYSAKGPGRRKDRGSAQQANGKIKLRVENRGTDSKAYVGSGLYVLSRYPIVDIKYELFGHYCTGADCMANKAILLVRVQLPGMKTPLDIVTSHMDANSKKKGSKKKRLRAHRKQTLIVKGFLDRFNGARAAIFAGDLNIKNDARYANFVETLAVVNAGQLCVETPARCETGKNATPETLWRSTNDQHFIIKGDDFRIVPVFMERNYDEPFAGKGLSDHLGFAAVYEITIKR
jgi:endonuclease/exonuclease/phosphatase family metal-dependent hydrolase